MPLDCGFIDDGYTATAFIQGRANLYPDVRFSYRPCLTPDRDRINTVAAREPADKAVAVLAKSVATRVVSWDLTDRTGAAVLVSAENVLRLKPALFTRLLNIVLGLEGGDTDPAAEDHERIDKLQQSADAAIAETDLKSLMEETSAKN